ncbi:hypothetical protein [Aminirod propionatiphilus]|uniref:Uncharacterized protein n=1 Tax=Aminirod propionatiphilus TaxID=3415223 RepID=A0ACD1DUW4_9BACT|nr:hypothetical protein KIH16_13035 [Synergistota bacterium]
MICSYAGMEGKKLEALQSAEKDLGRTLLAFSCQDLKPAPLSEEQLEHIKALEKELGVVVVAF